MTASEFKERFPEFNYSADAISDDLINRHLEDNSLLLNANTLGARFDLLLGLLVAHDIKLSIMAKEDIPSDVTTIITAKSSMSGSASFLNLAKDMKEQFYSATAYGVKYLALRKTFRFAGAVLT